MSEYEWVTDEMFDRKVRDLAQELGVEWIMALPGVWEIVSEELNNAALDALKAERGEEPEA